MTETSTTKAPAPEVSIGIPSARNVDHVCWTVPDLDGAVAFLCDVLGGELLFKAGPFADPDGTLMVDSFNVHARASANIAMLRFGPQFNLELIEFEVPDQRTEWPRSSDIGGQHLAIIVDDIDAAVSYLAQHEEVTLYGAPLPMPDGLPNSGTTIQFFSGPWGMFFELISREEGPMPYEATTSGRLAPSASHWTNHDEGTMP
jgi:catechol 2,3-dioxygenase-like lactoylglutathione lyase family enzyme